MMRFLRYWLIFLLLATGYTSYSQCGLDIYIANDQSGSVDAAEKAHSRNFILKLAQANALGNGNTMNRIAVADWSATFIPFAFPGAGIGYTTDMADIIAYKNTGKTTYGNSNLYAALLGSCQQMNQASAQLPGRTAKKLIVILTDLRNEEVSPNVLDLAGMIKASGISVALLAIDDAKNVAVLQGTNIASDASLYFGIPNYSTLDNNADGIISTLLSTACSAVAPSPSWDLTVALNSADCGAGQVAYTVSNTTGIDYSGSLSVSFFDADPTFIGSRLLATDVRSGQSIVGAGSQSFTFSNAAFMAKARVYAVVNLSTSGNNAVTPLPFNLKPRLTDAAEQNPFNNFSAAISSTGCPATPRLEVSNTMAGISCDKTITYQVQICNTGSVTAQNVLPSLLPSSDHLVLKNVTSSRGFGVRAAAYADPGGGTATEGYSGYQSVANFPCVSNDISTSCVATSRFSYVASFSKTFLANGVFSFPVVSSGAGVPAGATIISAKLTAQTSNKGIIGAIKLPDVQKFGPGNEPGDSWLAHPTQDTVFVPATGKVIDVTTIAQELVNQPGWTANSTMAFIWHGDKVIPNPWVNNPTLEVSYLVPGDLDPGNCATLTYQFQDTTSAGGTYNASAAVTTSTSGAVFLPNSNFTTNGTSGLNGYDGADAANTADDATVPATSPCSQTPQPITTAVNIVPTTICAGPGNYVTATVTITNPNTQPTPGGVALQGVLQNLNLSGAGALFSGEPYGLTNSLQLATPNEMDPAYPGLANALSGKTGSQQVQILQLPAGTSTFNIDIEAGSAAFNLASTISGIPTAYNVGGSTATAQDATGVAISATPTVSWTCPSPVTAGTDIPLSATVTGANELHIVSATAGEIPNTGSLTDPAATYTPTAVDVANGYASFTIIALSAGGCDASFACQVPIGSVAYDYGDAPATYDLEKGTVTTAAGSTLLSGLYLGVTAPSTEPDVKVSADADGDGAEEDGLLDPQPTITGSTATYRVRVTNNTDSVAYVAGFVDYNGNGNLLESNERSGMITVPANSGVTEYDVAFANVPATGVPPTSFMRLRLSTNQDAVLEPYGASPQGEVEDYLVKASLQPLPIELTSFSARAQGCDVVVSWTVTNADRFSRFIVQRSKDGLVYTTAGTVPYDPTKAAYQLMDQQPGGGKWYYRLQLMDIDGHYTYSDIVSAAVDCGDGEIKVYPTIAESEVQVLLPVGYEQAKIVLFNVLGQTVKAPVSGAGNLRVIAVQSLPRGSYFVQVIRDTTVKVVKIIKK